MKIILKTLAVIILVALGVCIAMQAFTNVYKFSPSKKFSGDIIYNPYEGIDSAKWQKANFHAHQRYMLLGLEFDYTAPEFISAYEEQGYDIVGLSDHQQINEYGHIPSYEHGVGLNNYHLSMLGAKSVSWFNYLVMSLPRHNMQFLLDRIKHRAELVGINHPSRHRLASVKAFDNLMGYDLMEMNPDVNSEAWDRALSNGIYSTLMANDDAHTISDRRRWFQRTFTMVNTPTLKNDDILKSLKHGRAYGVFVSSEQNLKQNPHDGLLMMSKIALTNDTISLEFDSTADSVLFIGQNARILQKSMIHPNDSIQQYSYIIRPIRFLCPCAGIFPEWLTDLDEYVLQTRWRGERAGKGEYALDCFELCLVEYPDVGDSVGYLPYNSRQKSRLRLLFQVSERDISDINTDILYTSEPMEVTKVPPIGTCWECAAITSRAFLFQFQHLNCTCFSVLAFELHPLFSFSIWTASTFQFQHLNCTRFSVLAFELHPLSSFSI